MDFTVLLDSEETEEQLRKLPTIWPHFFIPTLSDKPQDPIMDTLRLLHNRPLQQKVFQENKSESRLNSEDSQGQQVERERGDADIWDSALKYPRRPSSYILSWDTLDSTSIQSTGLTSFLSQRSDHTFAAARQYVDSPYNNPSIQSIYATAPDSFYSLCITLTGFSSPLFVWDAASQTFSLRGVEHGKKGYLVIEHMDRCLSESLLQRFLTIGILFRRLECLVVDLQRSILEEPCSHAFAHALSSILQSMKDVVRKLIDLSCDDTHPPDINSISRLWVSCSHIESDLVCLCSLCRRDLNRTPDEYSSIACDAPSLLSTIHECLELHLNNHSPRTTVATFAFLLTTVSVDYFVVLCTSVGYTTQDPLLASPLEQPRMDERVVLGIEAEDPDNGNTTINEGSNMLFPNFFSPEFCQALKRARQSLKLLRIAQPDHSLLKLAREQQEIRWFWNEDAIGQAWFSLLNPGFPRCSAENKPTEPVTIATQSPIGTCLCDEDVLQAFKVFDLEPSMHATIQSKTQALSATVTFKSFLEKFPDPLPSITPSLTDLTNLVLSPLIQHVETLHTALLDVFFTPGTYLNLHTHLTLLRSYVLLTSQAFKSRLQASLFSDIPETSGDTAQHSVTGRSSKAALSGRPGNSSGTKGEHWVIGLAAGLTEGNWPPAGADLSYLLRTVIIDALDIDHPGRQLSDDAGLVSKGQARIYEEAEWRFGFAIRDLPLGSGHAKWLDPRAIEALDFLYIDYQPPQPLKMLMSATILSKYHRLFAFNLRLMRVESVVNALFRMSSRGATPPFVTLSKPQKMFLHFRFLASSFVTSLTSYVYDIAIGGNYDRFLKKLTKRNETPHDQTFSDVFTLEDYHSKVMDDILSSCLLRSGQKAVGDLLRSVTDIILQFGLLMADRHHGVVEEYEAAEPLEELFTKFIKRLKTLVKVLKALINKGGVSSKVPLEDAQIYIPFDTLASPQTIGVAANLHNLLLRLDGSQWWTRIP